MITVNMHEAKTTLSKLVQAATSGEDVVLCANGVPKVRLIPFFQSPVERNLAPDLSLCPVLSPGYDPAEPLDEEECPSDSL